MPVFSRGTKCAEWYVAKMWFCISVWVKTMDLCSELSSLQCCCWYVSFRFSELCAWFQFVCVYTGEKLQTVTCIANHVTKLWSLQHKGNVCLHVNAMWWRCCNSNPNLTSHCPMSSTIESYCPSAQLIVRDELWVAGDRMSCPATYSGVDVCWQLSMYLEGRPV